MLNKKILVFSSHADDAEISMGGTISKLTKNGNDIKLIVCIIPSEARDGTVVNQKRLGRKSAQKKAAVDLGVDLEILDLDPYDISFDRILVKLLDKKIQEYSPDIIFTQWNHDSHQDHQAVSDATFAASRKNNITVLMYEQLTLGGITPHAFRSHVYVDISDTIDQKIKSVERYVPVTFNSKDVDAIKSLARFRGNQIGVEYAECFEICKLIANIDSGFFDIGKVI